LPCDSCFLRNPSPIIPACDFSWSDEKYGRLSANEDHISPLTRLKFTFQGAAAYAAFKTQILPLLSRLNLEKFFKFAEYSEDYEDLEHQFYGGDYEDYLR